MSTSLLSKFSSLVHHWLYATQGRELDLRGGGSFQQRKFSKGLILECNVLLSLAKVGHQCAPR